MMTLEEASGAFEPAVDGPVEGSRSDDLGDLSLDAFKPEPSRVPARNHDREEAPIFTGARRARPRLGSGRLIALALVTLALVQAAVIVFMLRQRSERRPAESAVASTPTPAAPAPPVGPNDTPTSAAPTGQTQPAPAPAREPGRLLVQTTPPGAVVSVDGERRGISPLTIEGLADGRHQVRVESGGTRVDNAVEIGPGARTTSLVVPLAQSGWVEISAPIPVDVLEHGKLIGASSRGPLTLSAGMHTLQFRNQTTGYTGFMSVRVTAEQMTRVAPTMPDGVLQVNAVPWAHVWVDGHLVGDTPLGTLKASVGPHQLRFVHPDYGEQLRDVVVSASGPTRVSVDLR